MFISLEISIINLDLIVHVEVMNFDLNESGLL